MSGPILEAGGTSAGKNDQYLPARSLPAREEGQTTSKESETDTLNPDDEKAMKKTEPTASPWWGGSPLELRASHTFLREYEAEPKE